MRCCVFLFVFLFVVVLCFLSCSCSLRCLLVLGVLFYILFFFFFFKQKTAYEMRISDWSSDVCSSDLMPLRSRSILQFEPIGKSLRSRPTSRNSLPVRARYPSSCKARPSTIGSYCYRFMTATM